MLWLTLLLCWTDQRLELSLKANALVEKPYASLSDVLSLDSYQRLKADGVPDLWLAEVDADRRIDRARVAQALARVRPEAELAWSGPAAVAVHRKAGAGSPQALEAAVRDWIEEQTPRGGSIHVEEIIAPRLSNLPPGKVAYRIRRRGDRPLIGRQALYADLYLDGQKHKTLVVQAVVSVEALVAVALRDIDRGDPIREDDIEWTYQRLERTFSQPVGPDAADGLQARTPIRAGAVLTHRYVEAIPLVERNHPVAVIARRGPLTVRLKARALERGAVGDRVRVKNEVSGAVLVGRVLASGEVELDTL